jgi:hypothetical protein
MAKSKSKIYVQIGGLIVVLAAAGFVVNASPSVFNIQYETVQGELSRAHKDEAKKAEPEGIQIVHIPTPEAVKAIYMSQCVAGTPSFRDKLVKIADETEINSIMIDIKDYSGRIGYVTKNPKLIDAISDTCRAPDIVEFIDRLHKKGIYVIGRITVFQDPFMSKTHPERAVRRKSDGGVWKDHKGLSFIDVGSREHWDYIVELSKESYALGFDELNFDYIRFPSDGNMEDTLYTLSVEKGKTRPEALEEFFVYLKEQLKPLGVVTSADLFGMVTTNRDDLGIGQVLERALPHFDYIAPMVYPSHYPPKFNNWSDPNDYPYELIKYVMDSAVERANDFDHAFGTSTPELAAKYEAKSYRKLRPWLQDFDYGGDYDVAEVRAQIKATYDTGLNSWMLWAPSNIYTVGALDRE